MKPFIIILSVMILTLPIMANACNGDCSGFAVVFISIPTAVGSTIIFPLIGLVKDDRENSPYWKAVGYTFIASSAGVLLNFAIVDETSQGDVLVLAELIGIPLVFGAVATYRTYSYASRLSDKSSSTLWQYAPQVSVLPVARGGSVMLNWSF